ncbi:hypothetical protein GR11A_00208 [Vibrio phage vB_VcorM_GR11A]|nr:hypothetical protein GR11A_00208 [Vibrio phage vB_VcorM_GR11A]
MINEEYDVNTEIRVTEVFGGECPVGKWLAFTEEEGEVEMFKVSGWDQHQHVVTLSDVDGNTLTKDSHDNFWVHCERVDKVLLPNQILAKRYLDKFPMLFNEPMEMKDDPTNVKNIAWVLGQIVEGKFSEKDAAYWIGYTWGCLLFMGQIDIHEELDVKDGLKNAVEH